MNMFDNDKDCQLHIVVEVRKSLGIQDILFLLLKKSISSISYNTKDFYLSLKEGRTSYLKSKSKLLAMKAMRDFHSCHAAAISGYSAIDSIYRKLKARSIAPGQDYNTKEKINYQLKQLNLKNDLNYGSKDENNSLIDLLNKKLSIIKESEICREDYKFLYFDKLDILDNIRESEKQEESKIKRIQNTAYNNYLNNKISRINNKIKRLCNSDSSDFYDFIKTQDKILKFQLNKNQFAAQIIQLCYAEKFDEYAKSKNILPENISIFDEHTVELTMNHQMDQIKLYTEVLSEINENIVRLSERLSLETNLDNIDAVNNKIYDYYDIIKSYQNKKNQCDCQILYLECFKEKTLYAKSKNILPTELYELDENVLAADIKYLKDSINLFKNIINKTKAIINELSKRHCLDNNEKKQIDVSRHINSYYLEIMGYYIRIEEFESMLINFEETLKTIQKEKADV